MTGLGTMAGKWIALLVVTLAATDAMATRPGLDGGTGLVSMASAAMKKDVKAAGVVWRKDLREALTAAGQEYRPVMLLLTSPDCQWCTRLKTTVLADPEVAKLLADFALVEVDVTANPAIAEQYRARGVPSVLILSADGEVKRSVAGYVPVPEMRKLLSGALSPEFLKAKSAAYTDLLMALDENNVPSNSWAEILIEMGTPEKRKEIQSRVLRLDPPPRKEIALQLRDGRLVVRLGAMELIEEMSGRDWGFDPWCDATCAATNAVALAAIEAWASSTPVVTDDKKIFSGLSREQTADYIRDLVSGNDERAVRAMRMLENGGANATESLAAFLKEHQDLRPGARKRIKEVQYILALKGAGNLEASSIVRKLLYGTLDVRVQSIGTVSGAGFRAMPVLKELLDDPDPLIREAVVDGLVAAGGARSVSTLKKHLKVEKDKDVVYSVLKNLGAVRSSAGVDVLTSYLTHQNEDLVVVALQSLAKTKSQKSFVEVGRCLTDSRWRVRVAALEAVAAMNLSMLSGKVEDLLRDSDAFVRFSAVKALAAVSAKKARGRLEEMFAAEDELKAPIVSAMVHMSIPVPDNFGKALDGKGAEIILGVMDALEDCGQDDLWLADRYIDDANLDIACAAVRIVASKGMASAQYRARIKKVLEGGKRELVLAVLESVRVDNEDLLKSLPLLDEEPDGGAGAGEKKSSAVDAIMGAFGEDAAPRPVVSSNEAPRTATNADGKVVAATNAVTDKDVMSLFDIGPAAGGDGIGKGRSYGRASETLAELLKQVEKTMREADDKDIRFKAALLLAKLANTGSIPVLQAEMSARTTAERVAVAGVISRLNEKKVKEIVGGLLRDPSAEVRRAAAAVCFEKSSTGNLLGMMLSELEAEGARLRLEDMPIHAFDQIKSSSAMKRVAGKWARNMLSGNGLAPVKNMALMLLEHCWVDGDEELVSKFFTSEDPWQRRAAFFTLGMRSPSHFTNVMTSVVRDSSEFVRLVAPTVCARGNGTWIDYIDKDTAGGSRYMSRTSYGESDYAVLAPQTRDLLVRLVADESPQVRLEAAFCLLSHRQAVDLVQLVKTIESFPDPKVAGDRVAGYVSENFESLGPGFIVLVPFVERSRYHAYRLDQIRKHFNIDVEKMDDSLVVVSREGSGGTVTATYVGDVNRRMTAEKKQKVVYFTMPGCQGCEQVEKLFERIKQEVVDVEIEVHNVRKIDAKRLNEALGEKFGVPENMRLVAPAVFCGGGFLVKNDITHASLRQLLEKSAWVPVREWYTVSAEALAEADKAIDKRFSKTGFGVVAAFAVADGINPCAFATIIFLLSYLQIARRRPVEIAQVGIAFIIGVFIAYFLLGLGLIELVVRVQGVLIWFRKALNWALAGFSLVIMVLSVRDGILCLKGRMAEMSLQLPGMLKDGIHGVIRRGARHAHFVIAAFVAGLVISVLELACTGQVYLPMIGYILDKGDRAGGAVWYLLVYNLAFILPLVVVFVVACFGLTSEKLTRFLQRHAAAIKFCTAAMFLGLWAYFVFGDKLPLLMK